MRPATAVANLSGNVSGEVLAAPCSLREFVQSSELRSLVVGTSKDPNAKITVLLVSAESQPVFAVKAPTTDEAAQAVEAEARLLIKLSRLQLGEVSRSIPRVVKMVEFNGRPAVVSTAVEGTPMSTTYLRWRHTADAARVARDFAAVGTWLADFQAGTALQAAPLEMDAGVTSRLRSRFADDDQLGADLDRLAELHERLRERNVPRTAVHGDMWFGNVLVAGGRVSGVVDWELGSISGEPVRDLVRFALMYALYLDRGTKIGRRTAGHPGLRAAEWGAGVEYALDGAGWFPELFQRFLGTGLTRLGVSAASWRDAAVAGIAEVAARTDDQEFARRHLELFRRLSGPQFPRRRKVRSGGFSRLGPSTH